MSGRGRRRDRLLFSALPPSSPGDALERNGTVRGSVSARRRQQRQARAASESETGPFRPRTEGDIQSPAYFGHRGIKYSRSASAGPAVQLTAKQCPRSRAGTSQWRFWNDRFPPMPLKNSEIEPLRKSRFRARRVISRYSHCGKAAGRGQQNWSVRAELGEFAYHAGWAIF